MIHSVVELVTHSWSEFVTDSMWSLWLSVVKFVTHSWVEFMTHDHVEFVNHTFVFSSEISVRTDAAQACQTAHVRE